MFFDVSDQFAEKDRKRETYLCVFLLFGCSVIEVYTVLTEIMEKHIFVGIVDMDRCLSLLQYSTKLYLVNHGALA